MGKTKKLKIATADIPFGVFLILSLFAVGIGVAIWYIAYALFAVTILAVTAYIAFQCYVWIEPWVRDMRCEKDTLGERSGRAALEKSGEKADS